MSGAFIGFAVALNLGSVAFHMFMVAKYRRRIEEVQRGHWQSGQDFGSTAGAALDSQLTAISAALLSGGTTTAGVGASAEPVAQEIIAERCWQLGQDANGPLLYSMGHPCAWPGPTLVADEVPSKDSLHGVYAQKVLDPSYRTLSVLGTVALSGRVVEGENGYRAERAAIRHLTLRSLPATTPRYPVGGFISYWTGGEPITWDKPWTVAEQLAERYQCDVAIDWLSTSDLPAKELVL